MKELEHRIRNLERRPQVTTRSRLEEMVQEGRLRQQKRARTVFTSTFGAISKKRGAELKTLVEHGRQIWK